MIVKKSGCLLLVFLLLSCNTLHDNPDSDVATVADNQSRIKQENQAPLITEIEETEQALWDDVDDQDFSPLTESIPTQETSLAVTDITLNRATEVRNEPLGRVHFAFDSALFDKSMLKVLDQITQQISRKLAVDEKIIIRVEGHTDERGSQSYNLALGERRAIAVAAYLIERGVKASNLQVVSYGEEKSLASGSGEQVWSKNRRVELWD